MPNRRLIPILPTALTLGNLACGFIALARLVDALQFATEDGGPLDPAFGRLIVEAAWFIVGAMVFDALDGRVARAMGQTSAFGSQLDSLADVVSFGMAPALMAKVVYEHTMRELGMRYHPGIVTLLCSLFLMGAALRLARFTISTDAEEDSHETFVGLPSPAAAATLITACLFTFRGRTEIWLEPGLADSVGTWTLRMLPGMAAVLGLLMISRVRYVHLAQRYVRPRVMPRTVVALLLLVWLVVLFHEWLLFAGSLVYVVGGLFLWLRARARGQSPVDALPPPWDPEDDGSVGPSERSTRP
ncbi:MAG: CDP-alcohol phosphatidyltransferase family protein [Planctomycetota bacterium]|jgi:CDP-diacylglycerol--serine O-phosphatidyltransferase